MRFSAPSGATMTVALCFLVATFEGVDLQAAGVAAPRLLPLFRITPHQAGLFFSSSTVGLLIGAAVGGWMADRVGRKPVLLAAVIVFGVSALGTAFAPDYQRLVLARFATGIGLGGALPTMLVLVSENTPAERRGVAVGLMYCGMPLGGAVASAVSLVGGADWRLVFYIGGSAPLFLAPLIASAMRESQPTTIATTTPAIARPATIGEALFGGEQRLATPLLWLGFVLTLLVLYLLLNWLPSLLVGRGFSKPQAALVQIAFNLGGAIGGILIGRLMDGRRRGMVTAFSFAATIVFLFALASMPLSMPFALTIGAMVGFGLMSNQAILYAMAPGCYPVETRGLGVGTAVAVGRMGSLAGPIVAGQLVGSGHDARQILLYLIPLIMIAAFATVPLGRMTAVAAVN